MTKLRYTEAGNAPTLLPCPFCGAPAEIRLIPSRRSEEGDGPNQRVGCFNEKCVLHPTTGRDVDHWEQGKGTRWVDHSEELAALWNNRAVPKGDVQCRTFQCQEKLPFPGNCQLRARVAELEEQVYQLNVNNLEIEE